MFSNFSPNNYFDNFQNDHRQGMMEFVENSDKALAALEKRDAAKQQSNEVKTTMTMMIKIMTTMMSTEINKIDG